MERVAIVGGVRTPFVRAGGVFGNYSALDLGMHAVQSLVKRMQLDPATVQELSYGSVLLDPRTSNLAREIVLRTDLPKSIVAHSVSNYCISGLVAINAIAEGIRSGRINCGLAGGCESMSRPTLTLSYKAEAFFMALARARSLGEKLQAISTFRPGMLMPQPPSPKEPSTGKTMGQHCEMTTQELHISREIQDKIAFASHQNAARAQEAGHLAQEIEALGKVDRDNLIRKDSSLEKLAKLPPVFDRSGKGTLTAGNSSSLTDGASAICLMSEGEAHRQNRPILGYIEAVEFAAIAHNDGLLMAPGVAVPRLFARYGLTIDSVDLFEVHEAFAAQVAANMQVWEQGWSRFPDLKPIGRIPSEKLNVNGGSIAIGHPFAATGGRLVLSVVNELARRNQNTAVVSVCAAGAMACAVLIRRQ